MSREMLKERFVIDYESDLSSSYLVVKAVQEVQIQAYQVEMIANNHDIGILPLDIRWKDSAASIYYNITSKLSLNQFLQRKKLKRNEFLKMIKYMVKGVMNSGSYLLSDKSFLLEEDYIYINPNSLEVSFIYIPVKLERDTRKEFRELIARLVVNSTVEEEENDNFLQRILNNIKSETFNMSDFEKLLTELGSFVSSPHNNSENKSDLKDERTIQVKHEIARKPIKAKKTEVSIPNREQELTKQAQDEKKEPVGKLGIILLQVFMLLVMILAYSSGALKSLGGDVNTTMAALALVLGAIDFLVMRSLMDKKDRREVKSNKSAVAIPVFQPPKIHKEELKTIPKGTVAAPKTEPQKNTQGNETEILSPGKKDHPYLQGKREGMTEEISISKTNFIIGRLSDQVDYVSSNPAVGKVHAEIITRKEGCFIKDLNSRNGTFLNDKKLDCNKEYPLNSYDKVTLANSEYIFINPTEKRLNS